ncbi:MAG: hypothetical protein ACI814_005112, partial [Mariniblastus sp.]
GFPCFISKQRGIGAPASSPTEEQEPPKTLTLTLALTIPLTIPSRHTPYSTYANPSRGRYFPRVMGAIGRLRCRFNVNRLFVGLLKLRLSSRRGIPNNNKRPGRCDELTSIRESFRYQRFNRRARSSTTPLICCTRPPHVFCKPQIRMISSKRCFKFE